MIKQKKKFIKLQGQDPDAIWTKDYVEELYGNALHRRKLRKKRKKGKSSIVTQSFADCESLLDVGCGFNVISSFKGKYVGVDVSPAMVKKARKLHPEIDVRVPMAIIFPLRTIHLIVCGVRECFGT